MKHSLYVVLLCISVSTGIYAQENNEPTVTLMLAGSYGYFTGTNDFTKVYSEQINPVGLHCALGFGSVLVVGRYEKLHTNAVTVIENLPVEGKADWNQTFTSVGLRYYQPKSRMYIDFLYVFMDASESITTQPIEIEELKSNLSIKDRGWGVAAGWAPLLFGPFGVFVELRYYKMFQDSKMPNGDEIQNYGGLIVCGGFALTIQ